MMPLSKSAMLEATRLTREGRLTEAMAVLQGTASPADPAEAVPTIDLTPTARAPKRSATPAGLRPDGTGVGSTRAIGGILKKLAAKGAGLATMKGPLSRANIPAAPLPDGARFDERRHAGPAGSRSYKLYVPAVYDGSPLPLVVMLHGCTQSPDDFAAGTRMNELAETHKLLVAYPAQEQGANANRCWNWFQPADQARGRGEPAILAGIVEEIGREVCVAPGQVFVAGLSAGGAAAAILASEYPDAFAAVGVHSGLPAGAAHDMPSAFAAMRQGGSATGAAITIPAIVFHGDRDATVNPVNGDQVAAQAGAGSAASVEVRNGASSGGTSFERTVYRDAEGRSRAEQWILHGAGHAWSGGSAAGTYTDPSGPDASAEMVRFFLETVGRTATARMP